MKRAAKLSTAAVLMVQVVGCGQQDLDTHTMGVLRWFVTGPDAEVRSSGCALLGERHDGIISFHASPGEEVVESQTWEDVVKSSAQYIQNNDADYWCSEQSNIKTSRTPRGFAGEECVTTQGADPVATIESVELIDAGAPEYGSGRRLRLKVVRSGPLVLTYQFPCDSSDRYHSDAWAPPVWTELTILP